MPSFSSASVLSFFLSLAAAQQCKLQFDGRVPGGFSAATFDTNNNVFSPDNVFGQGSWALFFGLPILLPAGKTEGEMLTRTNHTGLKLSKVVQLPAATASLVRTPLSLSLSLSLSLLFFCPGVCPLCLIHLLLMLTQ